MISTTTDIAQLAILHCGVSKPIGNLQAERSIEAQACRTVIDVARQETLRAHPWLFAKKFATPALVLGPTPMATPEWTYAYAQPNDCLHVFRFISTRLNNDTRQSRIPYTIADYTGKALIYTNWPGNFSNVPVVIEYTWDNQNISQWGPDFIMALSYRMAYLVAPVITRGDPNQMQQKLMTLFDKEIMKAGNTNSEEDQRPEEPQSEFVRARDGYGFGTGQGSLPTAIGGGYSVE